jgi:hypothetical protein
MSDVFDRLFQAYQDEERNWRQTTYAYRLTESGALIKPYLFRSSGMIESDSEIFETLRETYDGGVFRIFVRDGSRMVFSGDIGVWGRRMEQQGI